MAYASLRARFDENGVIPKATSLYRRLQDQLPPLPLAKVNFSLVLHTYLTLSRARNNANRNLVKCISKDSADDVEGNKAAPPPFRPMSKLSGAWVYLEGHLPTTAMDAARLLKMDPMETSDEDRIDTSNFPRPCSSVYSDHFALQDLVYQVDDLMRDGQLNTIEQLEMENSILQEEVVQYQRTWDAILEMFDEAYDTALLLRCSVEECEERISIAQADWLALWGITGATEVGNWI